MPKNEELPEIEYFAPKIKTKIWPGTYHMIMKNNFEDARYV